MGRVVTYCGGCGAPSPILASEIRLFVPCVVCLAPLRRLSGPLFYEAMDPAKLPMRAFDAYIREVASIQEAKR